MAEPSKEEAIAVLKLFDGLYSRFQTKTSPDEPLLLSHYTSVETVEKILKDDELWFSNPLYMNDLEEMRAGIGIGSQIFPQFAQNAAQTADRIRYLVETFNHYMAHLATEAALDTYVFCLCEHDLNDTNGLLSMWREYGRKGNGAALVFNTQKIRYQPHNPLLIVKVNYAPIEERMRQLEEHLIEWARITRDANLPNDRLYLAAYAAFIFVKSFSLVTKHHGFAEEREWRVIYVPERDPRRYMQPRLDYFVGPRGVEPKLKFKFGATDVPQDGSAEELTSSKLDNILQFILLGPTVSSPLARSAFIRMLQRLGKNNFADRVFSSAIPLRPQL
jgi:Protein of unknown function (DUF2971)